jgi:hypothetical protein
MTTQEYEDMFERIAKEPCPHQLSYYGIPFERTERSLFSESDFKKFFDGYVHNDILGAVHWSVVKYAEDNGAMSKKRGVWEILAEPSGDALKWRWPKFSELEMAIKEVRDEKFRRGFYGATDKIFSKNT